MSGETIERSHMNTELADYITEGRFEGYCFLAIDTLRSFFASKFNTENPFQYNPGLDGLFDHNTMVYRKADIVLGHIRKQLKSNAIKHDIIEEAVQAVKEKMSAEDKRSKKEIERCFLIGRDLFLALIKLQKLHPEFKFDILIQNNKGSSFSSRLYVRTNVPQDTQDIKDPLSFNKEGEFADHLRYTNTVGILISPDGTHNINLVKTDDRVIMPDLGQKSPLVDSIEEQIIHILDERCTNLKKSDLKNGESLETGLTIETQISPPEQKPTISWLTGLAAKILSK